MHGGRQEIQRHESFAPYPEVVEMRVDRRASLWGVLEVTQFDRNETAENVMLGHSLDQHLTEPRQAGEDGRL